MKTHTHTPARDLRLLLYTPWDFSSHTIWDLVFVDNSVWLKGCALSEIRLEKTGTACTCHCRQQQQQQHPLILGEARSTAKDAQADHWEPLNKELRSPPSGRVSSLKSTITPCEGAWKEILLLQVPEACLAAWMYPLMRP